jgi:hypothetical protein
MFKVRAAVCPIGRLRTRDGTVDTTATGTHLYTSPDLPYEGNEESKVVDGIANGRYKKCSCRLASATDNFYCAPGNTTYDANTV